MKRRRRSKTARQRRVWTIVYFSLMISCCICIVYLAVYLLREQEEMQNAWEKYELLKEKVVESESFVMPEENETAELPINFEALWQINPEIYAWIRIPDTNVDYPILQHADEDQSFYLTHDMEGESQKAGSIYTEYYNRKDFLDPNTVIYGHNMKNGSMFHDLRYFADADYFASHEDMYIYLPDKILYYKIFTCYEFDDRHLLGSYDFYDRKEYEDYIEEITNPRSMSVMLREDCEVTSYDRIVTLSTCIANKPAKRRLVQAVLVSRVKAEYRGDPEDESEKETQE